MVLVGGLDWEKRVTFLAQKMSPGKSLAPETSFLPPDVLERHILGVSHPPKLFFWPAWSTLGPNAENPAKTMKKHKNTGF